VLREIDFLLKKLQLFPSLFYLWSDVSYSHAFDCLRVMFFDGSIQL